VVEVVVWQAPSASGSYVDSCLRLVELSNVYARRVHPAEVSCSAPVIRPAPS
jgi:hypothetical protein